jgi:hypothetical protein
MRDESEVAPLLLPVVLAAGIRALLLLAAHECIGGGLAELLNRADEPSYAAVAQMIHTGIRPSNLWMERVFPGWPLLLCLPAAVLPIDWAAPDTAFIVCGGPYWGFHSFDRYAVWALPAYAFALVPPLGHCIPRWRRPALVLASLASIGMAF